MAHDPEALGIIESAIAEAVVAAGQVRIRVLSVSDEALALDILNALDQHGLTIVRAGDQSA
jgi:hypothetical protein